MDHSNRFPLSTSFVGSTVLALILLMPICATGQSACDTLGVKDCHITIHGKPDSSDSDDSGSNRSNAADAEEAFAQGNAEMQAGNYENAVAAYRRAWKLSYLTVHWIYGHQLRQSIKPNLEEAERALKGLGRPKAPETTYKDPDTLRLQREKEESAVRMRQDLGKLATDLSSRSTTTASLDFAQSQPVSNTTPSAGLTFIDSAAIAKQENEKQQRWDSERLGPYTSRRPEPPTPRVGKSQITYKGVQINLSGKASRLVDVVKEVTEKLPQSAREQIRGAIFDYILKHSIPEDGQVFREITSGTAGDFKTLLESLKDDTTILASPRSPVIKSEKASEAVVLNTRDRVAEAAKDKAINSIKDEIDKLGSPSEQTPD